MKRERRIGKLLEEAKTGKMLEHLPTDLKGALVLWDQLGFEGTIAVARRRDPNLAEIALYSFWGISVAAILPTRLRWRISRRFRSCRCRCVPRGTC